MNQEEKKETLNRLLIQAHEADRSGDYADAALFRHWAEKIEQDLAASYVRSPQ